MQNLREYLTRNVRVGDGGDVRIIFKISLTEMSCEVGS